MKRSEKIVLGVMLFLLAFSAYKINRIIGDHRDLRDSQDSLLAVHSRNAVLEPELVHRHDTAVVIAKRHADARPALVEKAVKDAGADSAVVRAGVEPVVDSIVTGEVNPLREALSASDSLNVLVRGELAVSTKLNDRLHEAVAHKGRNQAIAFGAGVVVTTLIVHLVK